jgi:hypothetical protein
MPFQPGQSGNPAGRPRGARNKTTVLLEQLLEGNAEPIVGRLIAQAKEGNPNALGLLIPALLPKRKDAPIELDLSPLEEASDAPGAIAAIITAVCAGEITPTEGTSLTRMVEAYVRAKQRTDEVGYRPEREKAAALAASRQPAKVPVSRKAPSPVTTLVQAPAQAGEPGIDLSAPEPLHAFLRVPANRSLPRLRQGILSTTSPLARSPTWQPVTVSPLLPAHASPPVAGRLPAATA